MDGVRWTERPASRFSGMSSIATTQNRRSTLRRRARRAGLRTVALFEAFKGVAALAGAFVFIRMLRHDVDFAEAAEHILFRIHIDPSHHRWSREVLHAADRISDTSIAMVLGLAIAYTTLRFIEGYGLWKARAWGEWLAIISGCVYLPVEVYELIRRPSTFYWIILAINIVVVLYIGWVRWDEIKAAHAAEHAEP